MRQHQALSLATLLLGSTIPLAAGSILAFGDPNALAARFVPIAAEPGEELSAGRATSRRSMVNREAFSQPSEGIGGEGEMRFRIGNSIFRRLWVTAPSSTDSSDGLGPLFNARGCQNCHLKDGRGKPPAANHPQETAVSMFLRLSIPPETEEQKALLAAKKANVIPEPVYGGQLQNFALAGFDNEGHMHITYRERPVKLAGGETVSLREPTYRVADLKFGPLHAQAMMSPRVAPPMIGLGLLEAIPEEAIRAKADPDDKDSDGISGRVNEVWSIAERKVTLGRFGWKAGNPTVRQQSAEAFAGDIGISTPLVPKAAGDCTAAQTACLAAPSGNSAKNDGAEVSTELLDLVTFYAENLAVPPRRSLDKPEVPLGKGIFMGLGCASCHTPKWQTGELSGQPHLSNQTIRPFTDLLLHDMGEGLADNRPEGDASGREWRTAPLWGLGLTQAVSGHTFLLHDGRARTIEEAILWHGGEAQKARDGYVKLSKKEREALLAFLRSL